jgi:hypothetical protein
MKLNKYHPMRYAGIMFSFLAVSAFGQSTLVDQRDKQRLGIEKRIEANMDNLIVLVQVKDKADLQQVVNRKWPANIDITYNILKDETGRIIYIGEFPTSESGDWSLALKHYFGDDGKLIAFEKSLSYFNEDCTDGAVNEQIIELYDNNFNIIKTEATLTDNDGKKLKEAECGHGYDWPIDKRRSVEEFMKLKNIKI